MFTPTGARIESRGFLISPRARMRTRQRRCRGIYNPPATPCSFGATFEQGTCPAVKKARPTKELKRAVFPALSEKDLQGRTKHSALAHLNPASAKGRRRARPCK